MRIRGASRETEADEPSRGRGIFQQKNICDHKMSDPEQANCFACGQEAKSFLLIISIHANYSKRYTVLVEEDIPPIYYNLSVTEGVPVFINPNISSIYFQKASFPFNFATHSDATSFSIDPPCIGQ